MDIQTHARTHFKTGLKHVCILLLYIAAALTIIHWQHSHSDGAMDLLQNYVLNAVSNIQDILRILTSHFECVKKESDDMISDIKDLREFTHDLNSDLREDITTLQKKIDILIIEFENNNNQCEDGDALIIYGDIIPQGTATENCKDIVLNLFWQHLNMNLDESELTIAHRIGEKPTNDVDNRKILFKPSRKKFSYRIFQAICELNPPFYVNYFSIYTRTKIDYIISQLKTNFPDKIRGFYSHNNETCILFNICDYTTNVTSTFDWIDTKNSSICEVDNRIIYISIKTFADLERFTTLYHNTPAYNKTCIHYKSYSRSSNVTNPFDESENEVIDEIGHGVIYISIKTLSELENFMSLYLNVSIGLYL